MVVTASCALNGEPSLGLTLAQLDVVSIKHIAQDVSFKFIHF